MECCDRVEERMAIILSLDTCVLNKLDGSGVFRWVVEEVVFSKIIHLCFPDHRLVIC